MDEQIYPGKQHLWMFGVWGCAYMCLTIFRVNEWVSFYQNGSCDKQFRKQWVMLVSTAFYKIGGVFCNCRLTE